MSFFGGVDNNSGFIKNRTLGTMLQVALKNCIKKKKIRKEKLADAAEAVVFALKKRPENITKGFSN